jgi:transcriptional regulator with XRE-family HTH domain
VKRTSLRAVLARRLREIATERGVALTHVADRAGIGRSHLWRLLNADASATLDAVDKIASALDVDPIQLLTDRLAAPRAERAAAETRGRRPKRN